MRSSLLKQKIFIATGGTGGHVYPALVVAELLKEKWPESEIHFLGSRGGIEEKILGKKSSCPLHLISIGRLNHNVPLKERIKTLFQIPWALLQSFFLLIKESPHLVLGMGGHASGPFLLMATCLRKKTVIWEPNLFPGLSNRILSRFVRICLVVFEGAGLHLKSKNIKKVSYPVRKEIENLFSKTKEKKERKKDSLNKLNSGKKKDFHFLVLGGSQGSSYFNNVLCEMIQRHKHKLNDIHVIHQTGQKDFDRVKAVYERENAFLSEEIETSVSKSLFFETKMYLEDIAPYYKWADLVLCRCGMGTLFELSASGTVALLVPLPHSSNDHQRKNAEEWVRKKASFFMPQKELSAQTLVNFLFSLKEKREELETFSRNVRKFFDPRWRDVWIDYLALENKSKLS